jgi:predicted nucleic acid-binding protein
VITVSDSSPLIALAQIGQLDLLPKLCSAVVIPPAVAAETAPTLAVLPGWVRVRELKQALHPETSQGPFGRGEKEAISLALELGPSQIILDDQPARRLARRLGLSVVGTVGILLAAKRLGQLQRVQPALDDLLRAGFFLSPELYQRVLIQAGESGSE